MFVVFIISHERVTEDAEEVRQSAQPNIITAIEEEEDRGDVKADIE